MVRLERILGPRFGCHRSESGSADHPRCMMQTAPTFRSDVDAQRTARATAGDRVPDPRERSTGFESRRERTFRRGRREPH